VRLAVVRIIDGIEGQRGTFLLPHIEGSLLLRIMFRYREEGTAFCTELEGEREYGMDISWESMGMGLMHRREGRI
jgi:hypothetical protein